MIEVLTSVVIPVIATRGIAVIPSITVDIIDIYCIVDEVVMVEDVII